MPIYEYRCLACGHITSQLVLKPAEAAQPVCKACASPQVQRLLSRFAYHRSEASRLAEFDTRATYGPDFYKDSRNVGLWAKKRAQELGVDLGPQFEETVEKARTGKILDEL
ncbi:MAG: FmdB family transcriptional regulator [Candidatus Tectimicrobiota bacterium]|nr:MAG: FmdB family transcriptional regulator [Candidatus Tectomicrobia bacterium]